MRKFLLPFVVVLAEAASLAVSARDSRPGVSILGDSYSTFQGFVSPDTNYVWYFTVPNPELTDVSDVKQTWWQQLIRDKGLRLVTNNSFSGATICNRGYNGEDYSDRSFLTRVKDLGSPDLILIFGGTNDSWAGVEVGEYDSANPDYYTFRPALDRMLTLIGDYYPATEVKFIVNSELRPEITESILTLCGRHGVEAIVLKDIDKQAGHPTVKGMTQIATQVARHL